MDSAVEKRGCAYFVLGRTELSVAFSVEPVGPVDVGRTVSSSSDLGKSIWDVGVGMIGTV
jgi:hypothetical protein